MVKRYGKGAMWAIAATVMIWSTTFAGLVAALRHFDVHHLVFLRWTLTSLLLVGYGLATRMRLPKRSDLWRIALAGLLGFTIYQVALVTGQRGVSASLAGFLINLSPIFTTMIAVAMRKDTAGPMTWLGLSVCTGGLAMLAVANGGFGQIGWSAALIAGAALMFSLYTLVTKPLLARYSAIEVTTYAIVAGSIPFVVFAPGSVETLRTASLTDIGTLVFLATVPGGLGYIMWSRAVAAMPAGVAARFLYLTPVLGVPIAWLWVGEAPSMLAVTGGLVTLAGVALASIKRPARSAEVADGPTQPSAQPRPASQPGVPTGTLAPGEAA